MGINIEVINLLEMHRISSNRRGLELSVFSLNGRKYLLKILSGISLQVAH